MQLAAPLQRVRGCSMGSSEQLKFNLGFYFQSVFFFFFLTRGFSSLFLILSTNASESEKQILTGLHL